MQLTTFFQKTAIQQSINPTHISIYLLLFHYWNKKDFQNPIQISRADVMQKAKVHSKATYHKCIKDLQSLGFIVYEPSFHPVKGSKVYVIDLTNES